MFLLDTNICIHLLNQRDASLEAAFRAREPSEIALCSVVKAELFHGACRSRQRDANLERLKVFFSPLQSLPFDDSSAEHYGRLRSDLESRGRPIGPNDLLIAAIAQAHQATLVTRNRREFERVPGLTVHSW